MQNFETAAEFLAAKNVLTNEEVFLINGKKSKFYATKQHHVKKRGTPLFDIDDKVGLDKHHLCAYAFNVPVKEVVTMAKCNGTHTTSGKKQVSYNKIENAIETLKNAGFIVKKHIAAAPTETINDVPTAIIVGEQKRMTAAAAELAAAAAAKVDARRKELKKLSKEQLIELAARL